MEEPPRLLPLEALQKALAANQKVQDQILVELKRIGELKARNRKRAAALIHASSLPKKPKPSPPALADCAWTDQYFTDKTSSTSRPDPNPDDVRRTKAEKDSFLVSNNPPWLTKDNKLLEKSIKTVKLELHTNSDDAIDFGRVAKKVSQKTKISRSADECRVQTSNLKKKPAWTDAEIAHLRKIISEQKEKFANSSDDDKNNAIDWKLVASTLGTGRTPWEVFQTYLSKIERKPKQVPWTPEEDEFLLKFVAAMGPQYTTSQAGSAFLASRFLPNKTKMQIMYRLNNSLLNPRFVSECWNEADERKLALCMKVYSESDSKHALFLSSGHIPNRSRGSVAEKWDRSIDPAYAGGPFSKQEDQELMQVIRANPEMGWRELSTKFFPHRHPHRLQSRFSEVAEDNDILQRFGNEFLKEGNADQSESGFANTTDYVVKVKKTVRMS